ncbi:hypothetical protein PL329_13670 [Escherichia coli]|uniref:hypothetical protein n=1 Tax=Escherichia coli TaxID=562 RepID=UPI002307D003|nr:hypothetical protein [Escherichia coli]WCE52113.1 hypothetical protein PL329_13670 [Escherichia coli]WCE56312.1 hypothetical protein PL330_11780 [Escherichia coli]
MGQQKQRNRRWVLASRPHGAPVPESLGEEEIDAAGKGWGIGVTVYCLLAASIRGRMCEG